MASFHGTAGAGAFDMKATQAVLDRLFLVMRTIGGHGPSHPTSLKAATDLQQAVAEARCPLSLQFVSQAVFRDRSVVPLQLESWVRSQELGRALENLGVHELSFDDAPAAQTLVDLCVALARGAQGPSDVLESLRLPGVRWRELPQARLGVDAEVVEPEVFAAAQVTLAIAEAEELAARPDEWSWPGGVSVVRRLERAAVAHAGATARTIETAPGTWTPARRAISAAFQASLVLTRIGVTEFLRRSGAHATLAVAVHGYEARYGKEPDAAAQRALPPLLARPVTARSGVDPHRLRVSALVRALTRRGKEGREPPPLLAGLVRQAYELERRRCPADVTFDLTRVDLLAHAARMLGQGHRDEPWVRALIGVAGAVPPGAYVQLADGRLGVALDVDPGGDPWQPRVLIAGQVVIPTAPVRLYSPAGVMNEVR